MPEFLKYLKNKTAILTLLVVVLIIPGVILGVNLVRQNQDLTSEAGIKPVSFVPGGCVVTDNNKQIANCPKIEFKLVSPFKDKSDDDKCKTQSPPPASCNPEVSYKFAETIDGLATAVEKPMGLAPVTLCYIFNDKTPGRKRIYAEFKDSAGKVKKSNASIDLIAGTGEAEPSPCENAFASPSASASSTASPSGSIGASPTAGASVTTDIAYRLAETEAGLSAAEFNPYNQNPTVRTFTLSDDSPGVKQIWVEFKNNITGETKIEHITAKMINTKPRILSADCTLDINKQDLKVTLSGIGFGNAKGKLKNDQKDLDILTWNETQVTGLLKKPSISSGDGASFQFNLTRGDGLEHEGPVICAVDTSMLALGARLFCRDQGDFDVPNVKVTIKDQNNNSVEETVTISKDGSISGLKTKLQTGKQYILSIKAPNSLRRNVTFKAGNGTTFVSREDGSPVILPIGDIAPAIFPDGKINTLDRAEIVRQWSVLGKGTASTGDFNKDNRVNSIDWACMRYDFNQGDDAIPDASILFPTPVPTPTPSSQASIPSPSQTSTVSPSPSSSAATQRAAYFLPEASGSGMYPINTEFQVDINLWSQNEPANLFSAQLSFDATALEVIRIDRGTTLTSWTNSSFDNTGGKISLIAGLPSPGLKTVEGNTPLMAKITFKGKRAGDTTIVMESNSAIYSNNDNANIISGLISAPVVITQ